MSTVPLPVETRQPEHALNRFANGLRRHWLLMMNVLAGLYVLTPFAAPILMHAGLAGPANAVYTVYSTQCHQLPERSFFLFGNTLTHPIDSINAARGTDDLLTLRAFTGDTQMGWKVAWSDRMVSLYTSVWLGGMLYALLRRKMRPLPWLLAALLVAPVVLDGGTHFISDLQGFGHGFRDTNAWLQSLTGNTFAPTFYAGDGWGSFNSLMRLLTGLPAGLAIAWVIYPRADQVFRG